MAKRYRAYARGILINIYILAIFAWTFAMTGILAYFSAWDTGKISTQKIPIILIPSFITFGSFAIGYGLRFLIKKHQSPSKQSADFIFLISPLIVWLVTFTVILHLA